MVRIQKEILSILDAPTYHGFPRTDGSMEREFAAIYADLVRK